MEDSNKAQNIPATTDEDGNGDMDEKKKEESIPLNQNEQQGESAEYVKNEYKFSSDDSDFDLEFTCETCNKAFSGMKPLKQHERSLKHRKEIQKRKTKEKLRQQLDKDQNEDIEEDHLKTQKPFGFCELCKKEFSGPESYQQHLKSKAHHKKRTKARLIEEVSKDGVLDIEKLKKIHKNKPHSEKAAAATETGASGLLPTFEDASSEDSDEDREDDKPQFECKECEKSFSGVESYYQHLVSKVHKKILKQKKMAKELTERGTHEEEGIDYSLSINSIELVDEVLTCRLCHMSFSGPESASAHLKSRGHFKKLERLKWKQRLNRQSESTSESKETQVTKVKESVATNGKENSASEEKVEPEVKTDDGNNSNGESATLSKELNSSQNVDDDSTKEGLDVSPSLSAADANTDEVKNTLIAYDKYKEYKKIMNKIQSDDT